VHYNSGAPPNPGTLKGKVLIQVSTGTIEEVDLPTAFASDTYGKGRRTVGIPGLPPKGPGMAIVVSPPPVRKIMHTLER
jgi:type IV pilus assembly protein PilY1